MKVFRISYIFCMLLLFLTSCERDEFGGTEMVEEGLPAVIRISYGTNTDNVTVDTKAGLNAEQEDAIYSIYVMTFNQNGVRTNNDTDALFSRSDDGTGGGTDDYKIWVDQSGTGNYSKGYIEFSAQTGANTTVYAVANVNTAELSGLYSLSSDDLDKVTSLDELEAIIIGLNNNAVSRGSKLMMFGCLKEDPNSTEPKKVTIDGNNTGSLGTIYFERLDAKVEFKVSISPELPDGVDKETFELDLHSWQVFNVPFNANLVRTEALGEGLTADEGLRVFDTPASNQFDNGNSFTFYILESNQKPQVSLTDYIQRDAKKKNQDGTYELDSENNWSWAYSPQQSPYVQIKGRLSYKRNSTTTAGSQDHIHADVVYNVHLGDFKTDVNNFWTVPNTHYTYNIYVKGVNNITVEVETSLPDKTVVENQPGAEGNVVIASGGNIYEVDAHYAQLLIDFEYSKTFIEAMGGNSSIDSLTWYVSTPYSEGTYAKGQNNSETLHFDEQYLDYKWAEFYISDTEKMVTYGEYLSWLESKSRAIKQNGSYTKTNPLYLKEFVEELKAWYKYMEGTSTEKPSIINAGTPGNTQNIYVTVFVNEYYYDNGNPLSDTDNDIPAMVRKVVNAGDRYMHILSNVDYSKDGSSSVTSSAATIIQKPIRSIYNIPDFGLIDGYNLIWGTETISEKYGEDDGFLYGNINNYQANKSFNGRYNTSVMWNNASWSERMTIVDTVWTMNNYSTPSANPAVYACLARNRDENGNGTVDTDEIKWYMAAIDQLQYLYIGENVIHSDAKLLPSSVDVSDANKYKYLSSTYTTAKGGGGYVLWAEEGLSTSGNLNGWTDDPYSYTDKGSGYVRRPVRCLRNLGTDENIGDGMSTLFEDNGTTIVPTYLNPDALRNEKWVDATVVHKDNTSLNIPYSGGFEYETSDRVLDKTGSLFDVINDGGPCPEGYRIPNQRELALLYIAGIRPSSGYIWSASYNWYKAPYAFTGVTFENTVTVHPGTDGHIWYVRCVKDVDAATTASNYNNGGNLTN